MSCQCWEMAVGVWCGRSRERLVKMLTGRECGGISWRVACSLQVCRISSCSDGVKAFGFGGTDIEADAVGFKVCLGSRLCLGGRVGV